MINKFTNSQIKIFVWILLSLVFIILSNENIADFNFKNTKGAATSGQYYISISNNFPGAADLINYHHAQRFLIPYLLGFVKQLTNLEINTVYNIFFIFIFSFLIFLKFKISKILKLNTLNIILFFGLIIFNPYILRYFFTYPVMVNDFLFILSCYCLILSLETDNKRLVFFSIILGLISRQTGIAFLIAIIISKIFFKSKSFFSIKDIALYLIFYFFLKFLTGIYVNILIENSSFNLISYIKGGDNFPYFPKEAFFGIFIYIVNNFNIYKFTTFLLLPLISILPILFFLLIRKFDKFKNFYSEKFIICLISILIIVAQPVLGGPDWTGKNIIRLISIGLPLMIYIVIISSQQKKKKLGFLTIISVQSLLILWSLHPTFSSFKIFQNFKVLITNF